MTRRIIFSIQAVFAFLLIQGQNWTWMRGNNIGGPAGSYGTMGVAAPTNDPGARHGSATWVDASGNLWLFGGEGYSSSATTCWLNDLWKYNIFTNEWTWVRGSNGPNVQGVYGTQGVAASSNEPGAREFAAYWTDPFGNFWMFGGDGPATTTTATPSKLGDLWKYNVTTNQWTWFKGFNTFDMNGVYGTQGTAASGNLPGGRAGMGCYVDNSGRFWLYGGHGLPASGTQSGHLNDLWRYDPGTNNWTWMKGSNLINQSGTYGTINVPSASNNPGGRQFPGFWTNPAGNLLYLFGGQGFASGPLLGRDNDMWVYNISTNNWVWIGGSNIGNQHGVYGTVGVPAVTNIPGGRYSHACWTDGMGDLWLFGGFGYPNTVYQPLSPGFLNDLFRFRPSTGEWAWMKGSDTLNRSGTYGTQAVTTITNKPGGREYNNWWKGVLGGTFWIIGGEGIDATQNPYHHMNDLWKFTPPCNPDSIKALPSAMLCNGDQATLTAFNQFPSSVSWYTTAISGSPMGTGSSFTTAPLTSASSQSVYTYYAVANSCTMAPRTVITVTVNPTPTLQVTSIAVVCEGTPITLTVTGATTYTWNTGGNTAVITVTAAAPSATFTATGTLAGCSSSASKTVAILPAPSLTVSSNFPVSCKNMSVTLSVNGAVSYIWSSGPSTSSIVVSPSATVSYSVTGTGSNSCLGTIIITQTVISCVGISESGNDEAVSLYPNPSDGNMQLSRSIVGEGHLIVFNTLGQKVREFIIKPEDHMIRLAIESGVYFYLLSDENRRPGSGKLIIH